MNSENIFLKVLERYTEIGLEAINHTFSLAELLVLSGIQFTARTVHSSLKVKKEKKRKKKKKNRTSNKCIFHHPSPSFIALFIHKNVNIYFRRPKNQLDSLMVFLGQMTHLAPSPRLLLLFIKS
jgi:hypothetical protein